MKNLTIETGMTHKDISTLIKNNLQVGEEIIADCLTENSTLLLSRLAVSFIAGAPFALAGSANEFKVVATNKKLFIIGYDHTTSTIKGASEFEYNEIKQFTLMKDGSKSVIEFNGGEKFHLSPLPLEDHPELIERTKNTFKYIASVIDSKKVINK